MCKKERVFVNDSTSPCSLIIKGNLVLATMLSTIFRGNKWWYWEGKCLEWLWNVCRQDFIKALPCKDLGPLRSLLFRRSYHSSRTLHQGGEERLRDERRSIRWHSKLASQVSEWFRKVEKPEKKGSCSLGDCYFKTCFKILSSAKMWYMWCGQFLL